MFQKKGYILKIFAANPTMCYVKINCTHFGYLIFACRRSYYILSLNGVKRHNHKKYTALNEFVCHKKQRTSVKSNFEFQKNYNIFILLQIKLSLLKQ